MKFPGGFLYNHGLFISLAITVLCVSETANATKHLFQTLSDRRYIIAPIGEPFGFKKGGKITFAVNDFKMTVSNSMAKKGKKAKEGGAGFFSSGKSSSGSPVDEGETSSFTGVFMLKQFSTDSEFLRFQEEIVEDPTQCLYNNFRNPEKRRKLDFTDDFDYGYIDDQFESSEGIFDDTLEPFDDYYYMAEPPSIEIDDIYSLEDLTGDDDESLGDDGYYNFLLEENVAAESEDDTIDFEDTFINSAKDPDVVNDGIFLSMENKALWEIQAGEKGAPALTHTFTAAEEGLYVLIYQVCPSSNTQMFSQVRSSFKLKLQTQNVDKFGRISYLTAGDLHLPLIYFFWSVCYFAVAYFWNGVLSQKNKNGKVDVKAVHHLMTAVVIVKGIAVMLESIRFHFISVKGHAEFFSFLYYAFAFFKAVLLFSVVLLLGSGWSLVRSFLFYKEKTIILTVLLLQVMNNFAVIFILSDTEGEKQYQNWDGISKLIDIVCCCLVMLPIVWQVSALEAQPDSEEKSQTLRKLKLFRSFYLLVMTWIYFTRVVVYLVKTILSYKYTWVSSYIEELGTVVFFVLTGYYFRPEIRKNISLGENKVNGSDEDAEYGEVDPLFDAGEVELPGQKHSID